MNIVHLQLSGGIGGISILTRDIALKSQHNNIFYFLFEGGEIADEIIKKGGNVQIENDKELSFSKSAKKFTQFCKNNNADVIICHSGSPVTRYILSYCKKHYKKAKYILYLHSNASLSKYPNKVKQIISSILLKKAFNSADIAVAISNSVKQSYVDEYGFEPSKTTVIYNGINLERFYSNRLNINDDTLNIIYVGRVFSEKGLHLLLEAVNQLSREIKVNIKIVGKVYYEYGQNLIKYANENKLDTIVEFLGSRSDIPNLLADADLFVHPATCEEGFGITLAEAMAAYVPCIAFNKGAIPELIDNGINGYIVDDVSADSLAQAIKRAYDLYQTDDYIELRQNAHKKAECFSIETVTKELEKLYE